MTDHKQTPAGERAELQRLCDAATPQPWWVGEHNDWHCLIETGYEAVPLSREDYRFAALARNAMPRLLADVKRLEKQASRLLKTRDGAVVAPGMSVYDIDPPHQRWLVERVDISGGINVSAWIDEGPGTGHEITEYTSGSLIFGTVDGLIKYIEAKTKAAADKAAATDRKV